MATTDQRAGFRLPWTSDQRSNSDRTDGLETANDTAAGEAADHVDRADDQAPTTEATAGFGATETAGTGAADESTETPAVSAEAAPSTTQTGSMKRPTKFLADLTKAMQAAAESARTQTITQLQADAKAFVEEIHGRSATEATELRRRADDDVAAVRDWSKAEIARIREETEGRIAARKRVLETQLEHHAAAIEREIEQITGQVGVFEAEMAEFFERLLAEGDPTKFAVMAENLPEPPPFEARTRSTDELMEEIASSVAVLEPPAVEDGPTEAVAAVDTIEETESVAVADSTVEVDASASVGTAETNPEIAMEAIQAAFEAAAQAEAEAARAEMAAERAEAAAGVLSDGDQAEAAEAVVEAVEGSAEGDAETAEGEEDPRLSALGLSGFDAAEAEAAAAMDGDVEEIPTMDDDALAARLNGLVPSHDDEKAAKNGASSATSQVVVVGLVSVASIASFKRHLGRIAGVHSVGVSSGPDGEFVFAVSHDAEISLRDTVPTLPGFQARVTNAGEGIVNVTARDPESEG